MKGVRVAIRIMLRGVELARLRFAISPVYETVMALNVLRQPGVHAVHLPWVRWARPRLSGLPDLDLLRALVADDRVKPAFLMPAPDARLPDLAEELRRVRATPSRQVRENLAGLARRDGPVAELAHAPRAGLRRVASALQACFDALIAPHWTRMVHVLEADIGYRAGILVAGGTERLFTDLHPEVLWADGELVLYPHRAPTRPATVALAGRGIVLCPSVFCWPRVTASVRPVTAGTLRYPARGCATLWESTPPAPDALAALLGRTRAALLAALARPATTAELSVALAVTAGAVSQHLGVLRAAGLVATRRDGRAVLHLRTHRAEALLDGAV
jgi:hypothetical protein